MDNNTLKLLEEFNRYFTSSNDVDVPARINVSRDEWRQLYKSLKEQNTQQVPMTPEQRAEVFRAAEARMVYDINLSWRNAIVEEVESHHGITAQCVNTTKKEVCQ